MTYLLSPMQAQVLAELRAFERERAESCDNGLTFRGRGISTPDGESHRLTSASADPADPREGRGVVVRGSDE